MSTTKVWNLTYALGNTSRVVGDASNPRARASALEGAEKIEANGWRVWVEHHKTGVRINLVMYWVFAFVRWPVDGTTTRASA
ncbi:TPA: hypothetical protein QDC06_000357 [Burkholderia cepacia]|nr:hypothetical protein BZY94_05050 [Burkholderia territorii]HDR9497165.1 hypothetical protein [Burkholderia cepacia]